jgi:hypothetical protein
MPTYTIQGKRITTEQTLTDAQIDEIAADLARAATKPANETAVTVQPTTPSMPLEDTNLSSAVTSALIGTAVGILAAILLHWLITRHLWRKPRLTPHQNGLWCGSLLASLSLGMGVGGLVNIAYGFTLTRADWDKYGIGWSVVLPPVYFIVGYAMGQVFRRLKPLVGKAAVEAPANVPAPSRTPSAPSHETTNLGQTSSPVVAHSSTYSNLKPIVTTSEDEAIYEQALTELSANKKPGLWAMALAQTANGGNPDGVYIALRVEQLRVERSEQQQDQSAIHTENRNVVSEEKKSAIRAAEALARTEYVNDFETPAFINLVCNWMVFRSGRSPFSAG